MRIKQKQKILKMIDTLYGAHNEIKKNVEFQNILSAKKMLGLCQEGAISIGTAIESSEGEGFITVSYIEKYCESIYCIYYALDIEQELDVVGTYKDLNKQLEDIEKSIKDDVPAKLEMVFLPYKVSMWDSLESVWKAADEDSDCDAYVIPIPYYDKNPDGTFRNEYYEGEEFPESVPVTHYNDYDFIGRHPDVVFIHNPYDHGNYVTSVHPFFYSAKIKEYCDELVYIPYYSSAEANPDNKEVMRAKAGFVLTYGVLNSDLVIVQSENMKRLFVNILSREVPGTDRGYWEKRILGLGSPKLDRVQSVQRDDIKLPEKWKKIIYTETGLRKKVILYNISVHDLLNHYDMLDKVKDVLEFFKENTDVALWWRPHPLYESTLASIRPDKLEEYRAIVHKYKEEAWGIFDEGVDLEWAIAETDAYYGDGSSVVQLYREVQKPMMYQNVSIRAKEEMKAEDIPIWPSAFYADEDDIWFVHGKMNILMRYNRHEKHTYIIDTIPGEKTMQEFGYVGIYKWNSQLFLIPSFAREIAVYNIEKKEFEKISVMDIENYFERRLFSKIFRQKQYLYCIPYCYKAIIKIDMNSNQIEYIKLGDYEKEELSDAVKIGNMIIAVCSYTNRLLLLDLKSDKLSIINIGSHKHQFTNITNIGNIIYLSDFSNKSVFKMAGNETKTKTIFSDIKCGYVKLLAISQNYILIDAIDQPDVWIVNLKGEIIFKEEKIHGFKKTSLLSSYDCGIEDGNQEVSDRFYYFSKASYNMYCINKGKLEERVRLKLDETELKKITSCEPDLNLSETDVYQLKTWKKKLKRNDGYYNKEEKLCGWKILENVKEIQKEKYNV